MRSRFRIARLIFVFVAFAVLGASIEAKLSLYQPAPAHSANTWQVIKLREIRIAPAAVAVAVPPLVIAEELPPRAQVAIPPVPFHVTPGSGPSVPQSHWFRPPPSFC